jgi:hypothetical protein
MAKISVPLAYARTSDLSRLVQLSTRHVHTSPLYIPRSHYDFAPKVRKVTQIRCSEERGGVQPILNVDWTGLSMLSAPYCNRVHSLH